MNQSGTETSSEADEKEELSKVAPFPRESLQCTKLVVVMAANFLAEEVESKSGEWKLPSHEGCSWKEPFLSTITCISEEGST